MKPYYSVAIAVFLSAPVFAADYSRCAPAGMNFGEMPYALTDKGGFDVDFDPNVPAVNPLMPSMLMYTKPSGNDANRNLRHPANLPLAEHFPRSQGAVLMPDSRRG